MARRARQGVNPTQIALIAVAALVLAAVLWFVLGRPKDSMRSVSELDIGEYVTNGDSMYDTDWRLTGSVTDQISWTPDRGQLISIEVDADTGKESLPVLIPSEFSDMSIKLGDRLTMRVTVGEKTLLVASDIVRS